MIIKSSSTLDATGPYNSSVHPNSRIIQKPMRIPIDVFPLNTVDHDKKKTNMVALDFLIDDKRKNYFDDNNIFPNLDAYNGLQHTLNELLLEYADRMFKRYLHEINDSERFIFAKDKITDEGIVFELDTRYSESYQKKIMRRAKYLSYHYRKSPSVLLTLTLDPKKYGYDKFRMWTEIKHEYNRFITAVKYYFKKQGIELPPYVCTIEAQKGRSENNYVSRGNPHLHICFLGASRLLDWRLIEKLWGCGFIYINRSPLDNRKIRNPVNYIMKYITKTYTDTNDENRLTQSLCWLFNVRSYQCSRGLITPLKQSHETLFNSEYLIIVDDRHYSPFVTANPDLIPEMMNPFNRFNSAFYTRIKKLLERYN
jgi:hypothetical protein